MRPSVCAGWRTLLCTVMVVKGRSARSEVMKRVSTRVVRGYLREAVLIEVTTREKAPKLMACPPPFSVHSSSGIARRTARTSAFLISPTPCSSGRAMASGCNRGCTGAILQSALPPPLRGNQAVKLPGKLEVRAWQTSTWQRTGSQSTVRSHMTLWRVGLGMA